MSNDLIAPRGPYIVLREDARWADQNLARNLPLLRKCSYCRSNHHSDTNCPNCGAPDTSRISTRTSYAY